MHPSWRDLVIESLADDPAERAAASSRAAAWTARRSRSPAAAGPRASASGRCCAPTPTGTRSATASTSALRRTRRGGGDPAAGACSADAGDDAEVLALGAARARTGSAGAGKALSVDAIGAWVPLAVRLDPRPEPPAVAMTWLELEPAGRAADARRDGALRRTGCGSRELLHEHDPELLRGLGFPERYGDVLRRLRRRSAPRERAAGSSATCGSRRSRGSPALDPAALRRRAERVARAELRGDGAADRGAAAGRSASRSSASSAISLSAARRTLPDGVLGSSSAKSTIRGYLYGAVWP